MQSNSGLDIVIVSSVDGCKPTLGGRTSSGTVIRTNGTFSSIIIRAARLIDVVQVGLWTGIQQTISSSPRNIYSGQMSNTLGGSWSEAVMKNTQRSGSGERY